MVVSFVSLLLGLTLGVQPVTVAVSEQVASVELLLDGRSVGTAEPPEWTVPVDFGTILSPHELEAVARGPDGEELGRAVQRINVPRPAAEADVVIEGAEEGRGAVARLSWESVAGTEPVAVTASFDGRPLEVSDPHRIPLPAFNPAQLHLLQVELEFSETVSAVVEATLGGTYRNDAWTELTSLPVTPVEGAGRLELEDLEGWFATIDGELLKAVALEEGPAEAVFVLDRQAQWDVWQLGRRMVIGAAVDQGPIERSGQTGSGARRYGDAVGRPDVSKLRYTLQLDRGQYSWLLWPIAEPVGDESDGTRRAMELFPRSGEYSPSDAGVLWLLSEARLPKFELAEQRLVDAVAVAGMTATLRSRRRAVVLVLSERPVDSSRLRPSVVRHYLAQIGVPLFVWVVGEVSEPMRRVWGSVRSVDARHRFAEAVQELSEALEAQRIVWFEGSHLPQEIVVTGQAKVRRVR
ncbi:MAG: hypothetical protein PVG07_03050 [Acidobacteriota bacterium]